MARFFFWMLFATGFGFAKLVGLAYVMLPSDYGQYAACFGISMMAGVYLSAGTIESTLKVYPREWVNGSREGILLKASYVIKNLLLRFLIAATIGTAVSVLDWISISVLEVVLISVLGACTAVLSLIASLYRATGSKKGLQEFSMWRNFLALIIVLPAGQLLGWQGALAADISASILSIYTSGIFLRRLYQGIPVAINERKDGFDIGRKDNGHMLIYLSNLATSSSTMVDKAWINWAMGGVYAGAYTVIMIIPQMAQLIVNVAAQHLGPRIIKLAYQGLCDDRRVNDIRIQTWMLVLFALALTVLSLLAKRIEYLDFIFIKYEITDFSLIAAGFVAASQIYSIYEFHLIARDREKDVFIAGIASVLLFVSLFSLAVHFSANLGWFIAAFGASRWVQLYILRKAYRLA